MVLPVEGIENLIGLGIGLFMTIAILSYAIGDNVIFRIGINIFVGIAAGYALVTAFFHVILPQLVIPLLTPNNSNLILAVIPLVLGVFLFTKLTQYFTLIGDIPIGLLVGVGAAVAIGGAIKGTVIPQVATTINLMDLNSQNLFFASSFLEIIKGITILTGTLATLIYFHYSTKGSPDQDTSRPPIISWIASIGNVFVVITFGVIFSGILLTALAIFTERITFLYELISKIF